MEDKDIIIDGVNAAECEFLSKEHSFTNPKGQCKIKLKDCKFINNCQYKQLNRSEQENAELKAENETLKSLLDFEVQKKEVLEAENERLKEEIKKLEDFIKSDGEIDHINHEYTYKLRTCLQEIKEIAETPKPFKDFSEIKTATEVEYDYAAICNELELRLHKVLELITKVESEG